MKRYLFLLSICLLFSIANAEQHHDPFATFNTFKQMVGHVLPRVAHSAKKIIDTRDSFEKYMDEHSDSFITLGLVIGLLGGAGFASSDTSHLTDPIITSFKHICNVVSSPLSGGFLKPLNKGNSFWYVSLIVSLLWINMYYSREHSFPFWIGKRIYKSIMKLAPSLRTHLARHKWKYGLMFLMLHLGLAAKGSANAAQEGGYTWGGDRSTTKQSTLLSFLTRLNFAPYKIMRGNIPSYL